MKMLNFACGARIAKGWENIDFNPIDKNVKRLIYFLHCHTKKTALMWLAIAIF